MTESEYSLVFISLFYEDLEKIVDYISVDLNNPEAAISLLEEVESAIMRRLPFAESYEKYRSARDRKYPYYRIYVRNYIIYYVVIDDNPQNKIMEVRRILYVGEDRHRKI